jgi:predicted dehydrogenase
MSPPGLDRADSIGWGVLGTAAITRRRFLPALGRAQGSHLAVLGSRSLERAREVVAEASGGRAVGSYEEVLADPAVDAVYIALPNVAHYQWILAALAAGKHVLCEKSLVQTVAQVGEVARAAQAAGRVVMEAFMYRFHPQYEPSTLDPLCAELGEVVSAHCWTSYRYNPAADRWQDQASRGGALWEIGCYCLDALAWRFGEVAEVRAAASPLAGQDLTVTTLQFTSGVLATAWWSFSTARAKRFVFVGTKGTLELDRPFRPNGPAGIRIEAHRGIRTLEVPGDDCFRREIEHFAAVVRGRATAAIMLQDSARWIAIAEEIQRQLGYGKYVRVMRA